MTDRPEPCQALLRYATQTDPPEYCDEDAEPGSDYCANHGGYDEEPGDRDDYKARLEDRLAWEDEHSDRL